MSVLCAPSLEVDHVVYVSQKHELQFLPYGRLICEFLAKYVSLHEKCLIVRIRFQRKFKNDVAYSY